MCFAPVTTVATAVLMLRTTSASPNAIHIPLTVSSIWPDYQMNGWNKACIWPIALTGCSCSSVQQNRFQPWERECFQRLFQMRCKIFLTQTCPRCRHVAHQSPSVQSPATNIHDSVQPVPTQISRISLFYSYMYNTWINGEPWKSILSLLWLWFSSATSLLLWLYFSHSFVFLYRICICIWSWFVHILTSVTL